MTSARRLRALALVAPLALGACAGPKASLHFGGKAVPVDIAFGGPAGNDPRAVPDSTNVAAPAGLGVIPVPPSAAPPIVTTAPPATTKGGKPVVTVKAPPTTTVVAPVACPTREPFTFPKSEADSDVRTAAPAGRYPYRVTGTTKGGAGAGAFDRIVQHTIKADPPASDGSFSFNDTEVDGAITTVTGYRALPSNGVTVGNAAAQSSLGEVTIASVRSTGPTGPLASFTPTGSGLRILQLRAGEGEAWQDAAEDPLSMSTVTTDARILNRVIVDACGQAVAAWQVTSSQRVVTPSQQLDATVTRWIATQYGGMVVREDVSFTGTQNGVQVEGHRISTITVDPGAST